MKTYTLCGSMRFAREMQEIAYTLETRQGYNILQCVYCEENLRPTAEELKKLERAHERKIALSDGIYVVNLHGYIGESVQKEIAYAKRLQKEIRYHCNKPFPTDPPVEPPFAPQGAVFPPHQKPKDES